MSKGFDNNPALVVKATKEDESDDDEVLSIDDLYALAIELKYEGKYKMAKQSCVEGIEKLKSSLSSLSLHNSDHSSDKNRKEEEKSLLKSFYNLTSQLCMDLKEYENSIDYCKLLIELDSNYVEARYRMAYLLNYLKLNDLSVEMIRESLKLMDENHALWEKFKSLLESIEKSKEHHHHHSHHDDKCAFEKPNVLSNKIFVHLIRKVGGQFNLTPFMKMIEGKKNHYIMTSQIENDVHENVIKHNNSDIVMQCMNFHETIVKNNQTSNDSFHLLILTSSSFSVDEFKNDDLFVLVHSCAVIDADSFFETLKSNFELVEVIESSNIFILENQNHDDFIQVKETIECMNCNSNVMTIEQLKPNTIVHSIHGFDYETYLNDIGWMRLISNNQLKSTESIIPFVFTSRKPLNVDKLRLQFLSDKTNPLIANFHNTVLRSKGFVWNCNDNDYLYDWSLSSELKIERKMVFLAAYDKLNRLHPLRVAELKKINKWVEPMGDRRNEIAFICRRTSQVPDPEQFIESFLSNFQVDQ